MGLEGRGAGGGDAGDNDVGRLFNKKSILAYNPRNSARYQFCTLGQDSLSAWDQKRGEYANVKEKSGQEGYYQCVAYIDDLRVYLVSSMDMHVYVFSQELELVNDVFAGERAITQIEYDKEAKVLYTGGVDGLTAWKITFRKANSILGSVKGTYGLKLLHRFEQCDPWVTKMRLVPEDHHIYVLRDQSVEVYDTCDPTAKLPWSLTNNHGPKAVGSPSSQDSHIETPKREPPRHQTPISAALWYKRSQYWITSCLAGDIKIWTRFHSLSSGSASTTQRKLQSGKDWALLHIFDGHTQGVTALAYLDTYGYIVSASLDGTICCWDVELLSLVTVVHTPTGITDMQLIFPRQPSAANAADSAPRIVLCLVDYANGAVGVWRINTHAVFFDSCQDEVQTIGVYHPKSVELAAVTAATAVASPRKTKKSSLFAFLEAEKSETLVCASRDIRLYSARTKKEPPKLACALQPGTVADPFVQCVYSYSRKTIFGLMNSGDIHLTKSKTKAQYFENTDVWSDIFPLPGDISTCLTLLDALPRLERGTKDMANLLHEHRDAAASKAAKATGKKAGGFGRLKAAAAAAGEAAKDAQVLAVGGTKGFVSFLDCHDDGKLLSTFDAHHNTPVHSIYYSVLTRILVTVDVRAIIKLWQMPTATFKFAAPLGELPTAVACSRTFPRMLMGHADGTVRMIYLKQGSPEQIDPVQTVTPHTDEILCLTFCDALRLYASSSADRSVHVRDFANRLLHRLNFDRPARSVVFTDDRGSMMLSQGISVITIASELVVPPRMTVGVNKIDRTATFIAKHVRGYFQRVRFAAYRAEKERERAEAEAQKIFHQATLDAGSMRRSMEGDEEFYSEDENGYTELDFDDGQSRSDLHQSEAGSAHDETQFRSSRWDHQRMSVGGSQENTTVSPLRHRGGSIVSVLTSPVFAGRTGEQHRLDRRAVLSVEGGGEFAMSSKPGDYSRPVGGSHKSSYVGETISQAPFSIDRLSSASVGHTEAPPMYMRRVRPTEAVAPKSGGKRTEGALRRDRATPVAVDAAFELAQAVADTSIRDVFWNLYFSHQYGAGGGDNGAWAGNTGDEDDFSDLSRSTRTPADPRPDTDDSHLRIASGATTPSFGPANLPAYISQVTVTSKEPGTGFQDAFPEPPPGSSQRPSFDLSEIGDNRSEEQPSVARAYDNFEARSRKEELLRGKQWKLLDIITDNNTNSKSHLSQEKSLEESDDTRMQVYRRLGDMVLSGRDNHSAAYDPFGETFAGGNSNATWRLSTPSTALGQTPIRPAPELASRFPRHPSRHRKIRSLMYKGDARWEVANTQTQPEVHLAAYQARRP